MDLLLTDEQRMLQDSVARMLAQAGGEKRTRTLRGRDGGFDRGMHERMGGEGWFGLLVPEALGGSGLGLTEFALVLMEAGKVLAPEPIAASAVAAYAISREPASAQAIELLGGIAEGRALVMPAIGLDDGAPADGVKASTADGGRSWRLDGVCDGVPVAAHCDGFLVGAEDRGGAPLLYVDRAAEGLSTTSRATVDGRPFGRLAFDNVTADMLIVDSMAGVEAQRRLRDLLLFAQAAELVGLMSAAIDMTVEYLKTRNQFGRPIGSFQALQHRAVDDFAKLVSARSFLFQVAAQGIDISSSMASALKAHAGAEALAVTKSAIQMHGGIGFTEECDIGLFLKRAMWLSVWLGNAAHHRARYAALHG